MLSIERDRIFAMAKKGKWNEMTNKDIGFLIHVSRDSLSKKAVSLAEQCRVSNKESLKELIKILSPVLRAKGVIK